ncbi:hypothetical protein LUZ60_003680 [Juncus effusus]|nr:hypothetical protein LUZ60_003680 [Juncus effusus]
MASSSDLAMLPKRESEAAGEGARRGADQAYVPGPRKARKERVCTAKERISRMPPCVAGKRSSIYRGVTRHRWTGRYEAHLWDKSTWNQNQNKKGKQVYLGAYDDEEAAARAYDLAALKYWGAGTLINFPVSDYARDLEEMQMVSKEDYLVSLRRKSSAFSRGFPKYRSLPRQTQNNRWDPSLGHLLGNEYNNMNCSSKESLIDRKIDLSNYIKWWQPKKQRQLDASSSNPTGEDLTSEIKSLESSISADEPFKLPSLSSKPNPSSNISLCDVLSKSDSYKKFVDKVAKMPEGKDESGNLTSGAQFSNNNNDSNNNNNNNNMGYSLTNLLSAPLRTSWNNAMDPSSDPFFWTSLVSEPLAMATQLPKNETSSSYSFHCQD